MFFLAPMLYILIKTLATNGLSDFVRFFTDPFYLDILWTTVRVSLVSTLVSLLLGYPTAYYMARTQSFGASIHILLPSTTKQCCDLRSFAFFMSAVRFFIC